MRFDKILRKEYDLNGIYRFINCALCITILVSFMIYGQNEYVNKLTIEIVVFFTVVNEFILNQEKKNTNPFLILLMTNIIFFYIFRVLTLIYYPWSSVLPRFQQDVSAINNSLIYIMLSVVAIYLGLKLASKYPLFGRVLIRNQRYLKLTPSFSFLAIFLLVAFSFYLIRSMLFSGAYLERISGFLTILFNLEILLLIIMGYVFIGNNQLSKLELCVLLIFISLYVWLRTMGGLRAGFLTLGILLLCSALPAKRVKLNVKALTVIIICCFTAVFCFTYASYVRDRSNGAFSITNVKYNYFEYLVDPGMQKKVAPILPRLFDRMGFLDIAADIQANSDKYSEVINYKYYAMSIIDNTLTPGFDIWDVCKAANSLKHIYLNEPPPTKQEVNQRYNSDMFTIFGEFYILFSGYYGLLFLGILSYGFQVWYSNLTFENEWINNSHRSLILFIFYQLFLLSFGLDWIVNEVTKILILVVSLHLIKSFFERITGVNNYENGG